MSDSLSKEVTRRSFITRVGQGGTAGLIIMMAIYEAARSGKTVKL
jgi:hypothetical protein